MDYLIPTACEIPAMHIRHLDTPVPDSIFGSKGVGEGGTIAPGGALANAVSDALGAECNTLPISPEWVQRESAQAVRDPASRPRLSTACRAASPQIRPGALPAVLLGVPVFILLAWLPKHRYYVIP